MSSVPTLAVITDYISTFDLNIFIHNDIAVFRIGIIMRIKSLKGRQLGHLQCLLFFFFICLEKIYTLEHFNISYTKKKRPRINFSVWNRV